VRFGVAHKVQQREARPELHGVLRAIGHNVRLRVVSEEVSAVWWRF